MASSNNISNRYSLNNLPTELMIQIFCHLSAKKLLNCRQVCLRWKDIIDFLVTKDSLWQDYFTQDYGDKYDINEINSLPELCYYYIYRSVSLWPKLTDAFESIDEFALAAHFTEEIKYFKILKNGTLGIHKHNAIIYYDMTTWKTTQDHVYGYFLKYCENDVLLVTLNFQLCLCIKPKAMHLRQRINGTIYNNVKTFLLKQYKVFYVTMNDEIYVWELEIESPTVYSHSFQHRFEEGIMSLGYKGHLYVITFQRNIYSMYRQNIEIAHALDIGSNLMHILREYNFLESFDWRVYFQWMYVLNHTVPEGPLRNIVTVHTYGDVVFVGSDWGVLRIYHAPLCGELNVFDADPIKQYNFMEPHHCPVLSTCPIIQIDVLETQRGHTVLVAMPKKIATINFYHI